jgi:hypothetical protein
LENAQFIKEHSGGKLSLPSVAKKLARARNGHFSAVPKSGEKLAIEEQQNSLLTVKSLRDDKDVISF